MKILTLVRQVPDAESSLRIRDDAVDLSMTQMVMDTMDEYGVEQALRLRETGTDVVVVALAIGPAKSEEVLRGALALGADRAIHVVTDAALDPISLSGVVATIASTEQADLIFCGGRQSDWDSEALGGATAERLQWPQVTWATHVECTAGQVTGRHDTDEGNEGFSVSLPVVITTQQGLNEPRFATLPNIVKSRKKELRSESLDQYGVTPMVRVSKSELQPRARLRNIIVADTNPAAAVQQVAQILRDEAGVGA